MNMLIYWKALKIDRFAAWKKSSTPENLKAWTFAIAKVEDLEFKLFYKNAKI